MKVRDGLSIAVIYNRDFEAAAADPENLAREDIAQVASDVVRVLSSRGHKVSAIGVGTDVHAVVTELRTLRPAVVFNLCESLAGDNRFEALLPLLMDLEGITYTGSAPLALSLALHKHKAKEVLRARGVRTPEGSAVTQISELAGLSVPLPAIVKPAREDASVGIDNGSVVRDQAALEARVRRVLSHYRQPAVVEEFIEGREINVSVLARPAGDPQVLPLHEIDFSELPSDRPRIVSFEGKWVESSPEFKGTRPVPCTNLPPEVALRVRETALAAFAALELRDYGRVDLRLTAAGVPYVIDVNPNCDLSAEGGGFARAAQAAGLPYDDLILRLLAVALNRRKDAHTTPIASRSRRSPRTDRPARPEPKPRDPGLEPKSVPARRGNLRARAP